MHSQSSSLGTTSFSHDRELDVEIPLDSLNTIPKTSSIQQLSLHEEKKTAIEPRYYYLKMEDAEFNDFRKTLPEQFQQISQSEAEQLLEKNKGLFKLEYALDFAADATNVLFPMWHVQTGSSGFILCVSLMSSISQEVLNENTALTITSSIIVWASSLLAAAKWIFMYSPWTEATKETLRKATQEVKPILDRMKHALEEAKHHPSESATKLLGSLAFQFITKLINISAASTNIVFAPSGAVWFPVILILLFSTRFRSQVWDKSVQDGITFWFNNKDHTSFLEQMKNGNYAIALKTLFEGISTTILKGLQFLFIAQGNQKLFGGWAPPMLMLVCGILHGLLLNYPAAFKNAMEPIEMLNRLLNEKLNDKIDAFIEEQIKILASLDDAQKTKHMKDLVQLIKIDLMAIDINSPEYKPLQTSLNLDHKLETLIKPIAGMTPDSKTEKLELKKQILKFNSDFIEEKILQDGRIKLLTQEPLGAFSVILNTLFGGYAGYKLLSPLLSTAIPAAVSIPLVTVAGAASVGSFYYRAISSSESKKVACEILNPDLRNKNVIENTKLKLATFTLAASGALSSGLSIIGTAGSAVKDSTVGIAAVVFSATQKMINDTHFSQPYIYATLKTQAASLTSYFKKETNSAETKQVVCELTDVKPMPKEMDRAAIVNAGGKAKEVVTSAINFWNSSKKPEPPKEADYIERNKFEF